MPRIQILQLLTSKCNDLRVIYKELNIECIHNGKAFSPMQCYSLFGHTNQQWRERYCLEVIQHVRQWGWWQKLESNLRLPSTQVPLYMKKRIKNLETYIYIPFHRQVIHQMAWSQCICLQSNTTDITKTGG